MLNVYIQFIRKYVSFFYGTFMCASTNDLDSATFSGVALTTAVDNSITHTPCKKRKQKRKREPEMEARQNESEVQKKKQG